MTDKSTVTVLIDDEYRNSQFLTSLGMSVQPKYMCMYQTPTRLFRFDKFGLFAQDKKVSDYLKTRAGIVIVIESQRLNNDVVSRVESVVKNTPNKPILVLIEDRSFGINRLNVDQYFSKLKRPNVMATSDQLDGLEWFNGLIIGVVNGMPVNASETKQTSCEQVQCKQLTSSTIGIKDMTKMFEDCTMPLSIWDHYGRLRIVHHSLMTYGFDATIDPNGWLCKKWRDYKTSIGHGNLWHYTLTRFWINILYNLQNKHNYKSFDELYKSNPKIHYGSLFKEYYSDDVLFTDHARNNWVKPNLK